MAAAEAHRRSRQADQDARYDSGFTTAEPPFEEIGGHEDGTEMDFGGEDSIMGTSGDYPKNTGESDEMQDERLAAVEHALRQGKAYGFCSVIMQVLSLSVLLAIAWPLYQDSTTLQEMKPKVNQVLDTAVYLSQHEIMEKVVPTADQTLSTWNTEGYQTFVDGFHSMHNLTAVIDSVSRAMQTGQFSDKVAQTIDLLGQVNTKLEQLMSLHT